MWVTLTTMVAIIMLGACEISHNPASDSLDILINDSGSTNSCTVSIVIHNDGGGSLACGHAPRPHSFHKGFFDRSSLERALAAFPDLSHIRVRSGCMQPISFASHVSVKFRGKESPDLSCVGQGDNVSVQVLAQRVEEAEEKALKESHS